MTKKEKKIRFVKESLYRNGENCPFRLSQIVNNIDELTFMTDQLDKDRILWDIKQIKARTYTGGCYNRNGFVYILFRTIPDLIAIECDLPKRITQNKRDG